MKVKLDRFISSLKDFLTRSKREIKYWKDEAQAFRKLCQEKTEENSFLLKCAAEDKKDHESFIGTINDLRQQLEEAKIAQKSAESRIDDLKETIRIERARLDKAIDHDREVQTGIRAKIGLIPQERKEGESGQPRPVVAGRVPWRNAQQDLQKASKDAVARTEEHWKKQIEKVENQDAERARTADTRGKAD